MTVARLSKQRKQKPTPLRDTKPATWCEIKSATDTHPQPSGDWPQLVARLMAEPAIAENKDQVGGFIPCTFAKKGRTDEAVAYIHHAVLDLDDVAEDVAVNLCEHFEARGFAYVAATTWKHGKAQAKNQVRMRLVLPLAEPIAAADWPDAWARLHEYTGEIADEQCKNPSRFYYWPACPAEHRDKHESHKHEGEPLNLAALGEAFAPPQSQSQSRLAEMKRRAAVWGGESKPKSKAKAKAKLGLKAKGKPATAAIYSLAHACEAVRAAVESSRNHTLNAASFQVGLLVRDGIEDGDAAKAQLLEAALGSGLERPEAIRTIESGLGSGLAKEKQHPLTDAGNAERFADGFGDAWKYCPGIGWLEWVGTHWSGENGDPAWCVVESARRLQRTTTSDDAKKWAKASEAASRISACHSLAASHHAFRVAPGDLDADPMRLNVENGVVDLRSGELLEHDPSTLHTKIARVEYDKRAKCPVFDEFVDQCMGGDKDMVAYLHRFLGYALSGDVSEQVFAIWCGGGCNGKSTLLDLLLKLFGGYGACVASEVLLASRGQQQHPTGLMDFRGRRLTCAAESPAGVRWNEALLKSLTGGDAIKARAMRQDFVEFSPTHKIVFATNSKPLVRDHGPAFWRRVHLVPWDVSFAGREDRELPRKLLAEAPGILATLVRGCREWQSIGLAPPAKMIEAVEEYRESQDVLGQFITERIEEDTDAGILTRAKLHSAYELWAQRSGEQFRPSRSALKRCLEERWGPEQKSGADRGWRGRRLRESL